MVPIPATGPVSQLAHLRPRWRSRSRSRSPLPKAAPGRPRGSLLLYQRGPTGLSVKCSPVAPPDRLASSCRHSCSSASANGPVEARLAWLAAPPRVSHEPQPLLPPRPLLGRQVRGVVPQAPLKHGNAAVTSTTKRSMWREISLKPSRPVPCGLAVPTPRPMTMNTTRATP